MPLPFGAPVGLPFVVYGQVTDKSGVAVSGLTVSVQNLDENTDEILTAVTDAGGYYSITLSIWAVEDTLSVSVADTRFGATNNARKFPYIPAGATDLKQDLQLLTRQLWFYVIDGWCEVSVDDFIPQARVVLDNQDGRWTTGGTSTSPGESFKQGDKIEAWLLGIDELDLVRFFIGFIDDQPKRASFRERGQVTLACSGWRKQWNQVRVYDIWLSQRPDQIVADVLKELTADGTFDGTTDIDVGTTTLTKFVSDGLTVWEIVSRLATVDNCYFGELWDRASAYDRKPFFKLASGLATHDAAIATDKPSTHNIINGEISLGTQTPQRSNAVALKGGTSGGNQYTIYANNYPDRASHGLREVKFLDNTLYAKADLIANAYGEVTDQSSVLLGGSLDLVGETRDLLKNIWRVTVAKLGLVAFQVTPQRLRQSWSRTAPLTTTIYYDPRPIAIHAVTWDLTRRVAALEQGGADTITIPLNLVTQDNTYSPANWLANVDNIAFYTATTLISTASNYAETTNGKYAIYTGELAAAYGNGVTIASVMLRSGSTIQVTYGLPRPIAKTASKTVHVTASVYTTT